MIDNCHFSNWFNSCSDCDQGFTWSFTQSNGINYGSCISKSFDLHCLIVDVSQLDSLKCKFCEKGFSLNKDGVCESLHPPECISEFTIDNKFDSTTINLGFYLYPKGAACHQCTPNYFPVSVV